MTFDLKAQPASISSAICGLRRIIIVFCFFQTNKMENGMEMEMDWHTRIAGKARLCVYFN